MEGRWVAVARADDIPEGGVLGVNVEGRRVCLYRMPDGIFATSALCTHGDVDLSLGYVEDEDIVCPLHQGRFRVRTGRASGVPCVFDLKSYRVRVEDGAVLLDPSEILL